MLKKLNALVVGTGNRGEFWPGVGKNLGLPIEVSAIAENDSDRREQFATKWNIDARNVYVGWQEAFKDKRFDFVIIATPDHSHHDIAIAALENRFDVLLEKPMATTPKECIDVALVQEECGKSLFVCHVLRYSPFFRRIKEIVKSKELGDIMDIDMTEEVGHWHFAHSYVRGNWRDSKSSSPIILAKSCHDLDIISWLVDSSPTKVYSEGSLRQFRAEKAPKGALEKCIDGCPVSDCIYDARKIYLRHPDMNPEEVPWPISVISTDKTIEGRINALEETNYGRCVYGKSGNDQPDWQTVIIEFERGERAVFNLRYGGEPGDRNIKIQFSRGTLSGSLSSGKIHKVEYGANSDEAYNDHINTKWQTLSELHGGGDPVLLQHFYDSVISNDPALNKTSARASLQSHLLAFAAEESRKEGKSIDYREYLGRFA